MTIRYQPMTCRRCGTAIQPTIVEVEEAKTARKYADCNYRCPNADCRMGFSNATDEANRKAIYPDYLLNVPDHPAGLRRELPAVLDRAINENREDKKHKFAFLTSEDAFTWVTFWYLNQRGEVARALGEGDAPTDHLLLWGSELPGRDSSVHERLLLLLQNQLRESPKSFSEPDVIAVIGKRLYFIEVKFTSPNDRKHQSYPHWGRYLNGRDTLFSTSREAVRKAGFYELTRNWVIGKLLALELKLNFTLVNLGPESCRTSSNRFREIIRAEATEYRFVTWPEFLAAFSQPLDEWFDFDIRRRLQLVGIREI